MLFSSSDSITLAASVDHRSRPMLPDPQKSRQGGKIFSILVHMSGEQNDPFSQMIRPLYSVPIHEVIVPWGKSGPCNKIQLVWAPVLPGTTFTKGVNSFGPRQNCRNFADDIFKYMFSNENVWISLKISLKFIAKVRNNNILALVQIMAWRRPGDKPLSEPMMVNLLRHICVTRPQWVKPRLAKRPLETNVNFLGCSRGLGLRLGDAV